MRHKVADYDAWRTVYDTLADVQTNGGVTAQSVHRLVGDGNDLLVVHQFETAAAAQAFFNSGELRDGMQRAGVQGRPTIDIYQDA
ncbi:MAG TPA: hypothetical protein VF781_07170 [Solirubrobacteraceae bacterium]